MAIRNTTLITKNSNIVNRPLPTSGLFRGEAIVNTADGILYYSGNTSSTAEWTPAGTGATESTYFEVGSNLFNLRLRNQITEYQGESGSDLVGKFLSGTTNGFVLADISSIGGVTDYTYNPLNNTFTITQADSSTLSATINEVSGFTVNGDLLTNDLTITGTALYNNAATGVDNNEIVNWGVLTSYTQTNDVYVTGATYTPSDNDDNETLFELEYAGSLITGPHTLIGSDTFVTGGTYDNNSADIEFYKNDGTTFTVDLSNLNLNDTFSTGSTLVQSSNNDNNEQIVQISGNSGFTPYNITGLTDTYITGFTFTSNTLTIRQNDGSELEAELDSFDLSNIFSAVTFDINTTGGITANSFSGNSFSGGTFYGDGSNLTGIDNFYVTGGTFNYDSQNLNGTLTLDRNDSISFNITGFKDVQTTGATLINDTVFFDTNESLSAYTLDLSSLDVNDTFTTGFTYNSVNNTLTISRNESQPDLNVTITTFSGLTLSNLTEGRVVYVGNNGLLTDESGFEYDNSTNLLTVGNIFVNNPSGTTANIGQGGLEIGSGGSFSNPGTGDLTVHGDLTVFGDTTTISTSELYIEDPQIELNYNPTGDTSVTSVGSGILIQDGGGVSGQDVKIGVGQLFGSSISGDTSEYTSTTGFENRGWVTQLNDIVIRNSSPVNFGDPDGVRVLAEGDVLDGGLF